MRIVSVILFVVLNISTVMCQDEPYYKDMSSRDREDLKFLPNLETSKARLYLGGELAFTFLNSYIESQSTSRYESTSVNNLSYGGTVGVNFNDNWYFDFGIDANPMFMSTALNVSGQQALSISSGSNFTGYSFTVRKKVWQLDKVTKNAALLLTLGVKFAPDLNNNIHQDRFYRLGINTFNSSVPDTASFRIVTRSDKLLPIPQFGFEVSGKIVEQVDIGLYSKLSFMPKGVLTNDLVFRINSEPNTISRQVVSGIGVDFGLVIRWNLINWVNYKPDVK